MFGGYTTFLERKKRKKNLRRILRRRMLKAATESLKGVAGGDGNEPQKKRGPYGPRNPRDPNAPPPKPKQPKARRDLITVVPRPILRKGEEEVDEQELEKGGGGGGGGGGKKMTAKMKAKEKAEKQAEKDGDEQEYDARGGMGAKRKRGMFARDLRYMMYGFGDVRDPNNETVALVEDLMVDFITNVAHQAMECAERRGGRFSNEDLLYVIRNDEKKLRRVEELMEMNEYLKEARKNFDLADPNVVEKTAEEKEE